MNYKKLTLEVCIPTFQRPEQLSHCLESIYKSLIRLDTNKRKLVGIRIHNNSINTLLDYERVVDKARNNFDSIGLGSFCYIISGLDIGASSNNYGVIISANSDYVWYMPDDDLSRHDSIETILDAIHKFSPALIVGGFEHHIGIDYSINCNNDNRIPFLNELNSIHSIINEEKVNFFFKTNPVAAQNLVFKHSALKNFLLGKDLNGLINPFLCTFFSLICLKNDAPVIFLKYSIGLFRYNEPYSDWRHEWPSYALQIWPKSVSCWVNLGLLEEKNPASRFYVKTLDYFMCRLYLLIWGTRRSKINLFEIIEYYPKDFFVMVFSAPLYCTKKIISKVVSYLKIIF
jgi:hypothetical protein